LHLYNHVNDEDPLNEQQFYSLLIEKSLKDFREKMMKTYMDLELEYHHIDRIIYLYIFQWMDYILEQDFLIPKNDF